MTERRLAGTIGPILVALLVLAAAEGALRTAGWRGPETSVDPHANVTPLFLRADDGGTAVYRRRDAPERFLAEKPAGALRVFVLGESSVAGTPYGTPHAFPAALQRLLAAAQPGRTVEVVNCGVAGVASWHVRRIAAEIAAHRPDLVIVYTGHNDWIIRAPGERSLFGPRPGTAWLAKLRLYELATLAAAKLRPPLDPLDPRRTRDRREPFHAVEARVTGWSTLSRADRHAIERRFFRQFDRILEAARTAGAAVVVGTLAQNFRDWPPAASRHADGLAPAARAAWDAAFARGERARARGDWSEALAAYAEAGRVDAEPARLHFAMARCLESLGRWTEARAAYRRASDLDAAVLGAPTDFNRRIARRAARRGAVVVDLPAWLDRWSDHGLAGRRFFYDHVHPNLAGHQAIANALLVELRRGPLATAAPWRDPALAAFPATPADPLLRRQEYVTRVLVLLWVHRYDEALRTAKRAARDFPDLRRVYDDLRRQVGVGGAEGARESSTAGPSEEPAG